VSGSQRTHSPIFPLVIYSHSHRASKMPSAELRLWRHTQSEWEKKIISQAVAIFINHVNLLHLRFQPFRNIFSREQKKEIINSTRMWPLMRDISIAISIQPPQKKVIKHIFRKDVNLLLPSANDDNEATYH
jgi:hypothetical protein